MIIRDIKADVVDRKWDTQGSVSIGEVAVKDYITVGKGGGKGKWDMQGSVYMEEVIVKD